ncbi:hypothetical protein LCGC14_2071820 [marine sediment metagenome]|uniref:Uncharacterized protein n=1 Tax=marine sediment metagenome TaxID=412755 RepID=A0A0F9EI54_9ZZZZ
MNDLLAAAREADRARIQAAIRCCLEGRELAPKKRLYAPVLWALRVAGLLLLGASVRCALNCHSAQLLARAHALRSLLAS